ncbi:MAG: hypothetical protein PHX64_02355 [Candidatus Omnitrophica bacterium]|nr:hypothetical protein [Candidatus Omnitrophota bacterium]MDD5310577.1 hypothetical protein [Candidatus Omnitrophota bacterium]MDD5545997.1 hypothetical protein [Candidatus Omnitrophota bacterium]
MKNIVFRADAKTCIGTGDLVSLIHLSRYFEKEGWRAHFIIRGYDLGLALAEKHALKNLSVIDPDSGIEEEVDNINRYIKKNGIDAAFFEITERPLADYRGITPEAIKACVCFDGAVPDDFDLVVNWDVSAEETFRGRAAGRARFLLGPQYVILPADFQFDRIRERKDKETVRTVLITLGGADEFDLTKKAVEALAGLDTSLELHIILGSGYRYRETLKRRLGDLALKYELKQNIASMFQEYMNCDLAISAGGLTAYELVCTRTPALLTAVYEHQVTRCEYFDKKRYARYMGFRTIDPVMVKEALRRSVAVDPGIFPRTDSIREAVDEIYERHHA